MSDTFEVKRGELGFTIVTNSVIKDARLSWQAKGLYTYLVSNTVNWQVFKKEIESHATNGRESTANAWKELVKLGWITSVAKQKNGKMDGWHHTVHCDLGRERPNRELPIDGLPVRRENRKTENPQLISNNTKKEQLKKNVSNDTLDEIWVELSRIWKLSNSPVGNKQKAISSLKKLKLTDELLYRKLVTEAEKHTAAVRELNNSGKPDLNLPNVTTWVNQRRWEQTVTDYYSVNKQKTPPGSAQPPQNQGMRQIRKL